MKKFIIEREVPSIGAMGPEQLRDTVSRFNHAEHLLGGKVHWLESFLAADRLFCVYAARDVSLIHRHAELAGFPVSRVTEIGKVIGSSFGLFRSW